jgi:hypothetical protein
LTLIRRRGDPLGMYWFELASEGKIISQYRRVVPYKALYGNWDMDGASVEVARLLGAPIV